MKIAVGSDEFTNLTKYVVEELKRRGHEVVLCGSLSTNKPVPWPKVGREVAEKVASKECDEGILFCWTGTGVSIVANKLPGIRAALCVDAETARGARKWNNANILVMSLRLVSEPIAKEILDAWFSTKFDPREKECIEMVTEVERTYMRTRS